MNRPGRLRPANELTLRFGKGSGVVFGGSVLHVVGRCPKTTPDPVRFACHQTKSYCPAGPYDLPVAFISRFAAPVEGG
jgi:hypothetical protein